MSEYGECVLLTPGERPTRRKPGLRESTLERVPDKMAGFIRDPHICSRSFSSARVRSDR